MRLTQKYREEAQAIADEIREKYGISCSIGISANEANNNIDKALEYVDEIIHQVENTGFITTKAQLNKEVRLYNYMNAKQSLERLRVACNKLHGEIKDSGVVFMANNL